MNGIKNISSGKTFGVEKKFEIGSRRCELHAIQNYQFLSARDSRMRQTLAYNTHRR
jgi:hypothetical protein